jgi:hypothetical protein
LILIQPSVLNKKDTMNIKSYLLLASFLVVTIPARSQEKLQKGKEIPILAWYSIPPEQTSVSRYLELKDAGFTHNLSFFNDAETMAKGLDTARLAGIKMIVYCPELKSATKETVRRFMNHPAVAGYMLRDEPNRADFPELADWAKKIRSADNSHFCYLNLFPNYATEQQLGTKSYGEHVNLFVSEVPVQFISFDHYPVLGDSLRANWYENLEIISEAAKKAGKPFWAFALSVAHGKYPVPTIAQLRLQVFSDLAYGAQGIQYFTYWTPFDTTWNFNNGPITLEGKRTPVYDRVRQVNKEIQDLSFVFSGAKVLSVSHTGCTVPMGTKMLSALPDEIKELKTEGTGAVVSLLVNNGIRYLAIVNRDFKTPMRLTIECTPVVKRVLKDGSLVDADKYQTQMEIDPGDISVYMLGKN